MAMPKRTQRHRRRKGFQARHTQQPLPVVNSQYRGQTYNRWDKHSFSNADCPAQELSLDFKHLKTIWLSLPFDTSLKDPDMLCRTPWNFDISKKAFLCLCWPPQTIDETTDRGTATNESPEQGGFSAKSKAMWCPSMQPQKKIWNEIPELLKWGYQHSPVGRCTRHQWSHPCSPQIGVLLLHAWIFQSHVHQMQTLLFQLPQTSGMLQHMSTINILALFHDNIAYSSLVPVYTRRDH